MRSRNTGQELPLTGSGRVLRDIRRTQRVHEEDVSLARAEHEDPLEAELVRDPLAEDLRDIGALRDGLQVQRELRQRLEVVPAAAQLALVHRGERGGHQHDDPEHDDVADQQAELGVAQRDVVARRRRDQAALLGVEGHQQEQRVPQRQLQSRPIGRQQRDRDQVDQDQEADGARGPGERVGDPCQEDAVDHQDHAEQRQGAPLAQLPDALGAERDGQVYADADR